MERLVDLDRAAAEISLRRMGWHEQGLVVAEPTWRDAVAARPRVLETDRSKVKDPESVGVHLHSFRGAELAIVLFRGGWADVDFITDSLEIGVIAAPDISSAPAFGELLDLCVARIFGLSEAEQ